MIRDIMVGGIMVAILLFAVFGFVDAIGWHVLQRQCRREDVTPRTLFRLNERAERRRRA